MGVLRRVWLTLSPRNPLKDPATSFPTPSGWPCSTSPWGRRRPSTYATSELSMPRPRRFHQHARRLLAERYPAALPVVIGSDNWRIFDQMALGGAILQRQYGVTVPFVQGQEPHRRPEVVDAPSTCRAPLCADRSPSGRNMNYHFLPPGVYKYIIDNKLYRNEHFRKHSRHAPWRASLVSFTWHRRQRRRPGRPRWHLERAYSTCRRLPTAPSPRPTDPLRHGRHRHKRRLRHGAISPPPVDEST